MSNVLIISGHPNLTKSIANAAIISELETLLPNAEIRKLDQLHDHYEFDVKDEQRTVEQADVIVWQVPFYWYSMPALMKKWLDDTFVHGFAHGSTAKLAGKKLLVSITTGAPESVYQKDGFFQHTMEDYLAGFETTAILCNLDYQGAMWLNGVSYVGRDEQAIQTQQADAKAYAKKLADKINRL
ncbi:MULTISPECIES: NAD(P)H-dependent oxidoreductase [Glaesserella]|uniref:NAD(P)H dehydrogenase n=1 Tax=Glaesserella australis TaxID=2094024 RepID=A0A328C2D5_9PAST|nr:MULTISPECIES: NAD(P)H-dependent oxidoreductase [Glaesserella]AUI66876.1 NAD(P)H dehydrogenase [Glaesserella sp. 15-184]RAL19927.1 NAD(P)H dehydrogenase [Glaesserella australis]